MAIKCPPSSKKQNDPNYLGILSRTGKKAWDAAWYATPKKFDSTFTEWATLAKTLEIYNAWWSENRFLLNDFKNAKLADKPEILRIIAESMQIKTRQLWGNKIMERLTAWLLKVSKKKVGEWVFDFRQETADTISRDLSNDQKNFLWLFKVVDIEFYDRMIRWEDSAYNEVLWDNPNYANNKDRGLRDLRLFVWDYMQWRWTIWKWLWRLRKSSHKVFAKRPAFIKVALYALPFYMFGGVWWVTLWAISAAWVAHNLLRLWMFQASRFPVLNKADRKDIEWALWIRYDSDRWRLKSLYDFVFGTGTESSWFGWWFDRAQIAFMSLLNGTGVVDMPARPFYVEYAVNAVMESMRNDSMTYEENIIAIKESLQDPQVRAKAVNSIHSIAREESGMSQFWKGSLTNRWSVGMFMNILWSWWYNKWTYYMRWISMWLNRMRYKRWLERWDSNVVSNYQERFGGNADLWLTISTLGHWMLKAYRIASMLEAWKNDDDEELFRNMWDIFMWTAIPIQAIHSSGILRTMIEWIESMFYMAWVSDWSRDLQDYINEFDPDADYKVWTAMFVVKQINKLLTWARFYADILNNMQKEQRYWEDWWIKGMFNWIINYSNRLNWYLNDDMYLAEEDWMIRTIGTDWFLNIVLQIQTNPFKREFSNASQLRSFLTNYPRDESEWEMSLSTLWFIYHAAFWKYWSYGIPFRNAENQYTPLREVINAIDDHGPTYNFLYHGNTDWLSINTLDKWYHTFTKHRRTSWFKIDPSTGQRSVRHNLKEWLMIENTMKEILWENRFNKYLESIKSLQEAWLWSSDETRYSYLLETKAMLELYFQWQEDWDSRADIVWQQFLAYTMQKHFEWLIEERWYSRRWDAPEDVQKMLRAETFKTYGPLARMTDQKAFEDVVLFSIAESDPDIQKHFTRLTDQDTWEIVYNFDTNVQWTFEEKTLMSAHILWAKNISEGNPFGVIATDLINLKSSYLKKVAYDNDFSDSQIEFIHNAFIIESARMREMMAESWIYNDHDIAAFTASMYLNAPRMYAEFLQNEDIDPELREGVAKQLFSANIVSIMEWIDWTVENPDQIVNEYLWDVAQYLWLWNRGNSGFSWPRSNYRHIYNNYRDVYMNSLSNVFSDYERHVFKNNNYWWGYNSYERSYITQRWYLNQTRTVYPVFDLWGVWASTGVSKGTGVSWRRAKARKLPELEAKNEQRGIVDARWGEMKIKASKVFTEWTLN